MKYFKKLSFGFLFLCASTVSIAQRDSTFKYSDTLFTVGQTKKISELRFFYHKPLQVVQKPTFNDSIIDSIYVFLIANPSLSIKIISHTDTRGSSTANLTLSQKRAESIKQLVVEKGINPNRIIPVGKGESEPIIPEKKITYEIKNCFPKKYNQMHATNRRTIIKIIGL